ncbi:MAG: universal stress protein [Spirochaetales bacterium]|nr:MAG: universal stress protein [Spirochaetales bacterium]
MNSPVSNILVFVDGTEQSVTAAQYGICLAKSLKVKLYVLYVVNTRALQDLVKTRIFVKAEQEEYEKDLEADAERYLIHVKTLAARKGVEVKALKAQGTVNAEIRNVIEQNKIDLLILGELSQIRSRRDEFYDESERAMRTVPCSVLIVKDEDRVWDLYDSLP